MRQSIQPMVLGTAALLAGCTTLEEVPEVRVGQAVLYTAEGLPAGTAQLYRDATGMRLAIAATGLAPGDHGFHLHTTGKCEAPGFTSAGGHLNPAGHSHGSLSPDGAHLGDLPNLTAGAGGSAAATEPLEGNADTLMAEIFDADGTAVVIHADADDYRSDPSGNAGKRVACGVLKPVS